MDRNEKLLKAQAWLNDEQTREIDIDETVKKMIELTNSIENDEKIDSQNYLYFFEKRARDANLSFDGLTKKQQLQIAEKIRHSGTIYNAYISNAAYQVFTFAEAGYNNVEQIVEGFSGNDLRQIYLLVTLFHGTDKPFSKKLEEIKDKTLNAEQESSDGNQPNAE